MSYNIDKATGGGAFGDDFPAGLRVLSVGDDPTLEQMLQLCHYEGIICKRASDAFCFLQESSNKFDIVMIDINMTGINDGIRLLQKIVAHTNSPVIVISKRYNKDLAMKATLKGAIGYLVKPLKLEEVRVIWQHVVRNRNNRFKLSNGSTINDSKDILTSESNENGHCDEDNKEDYRNDEVDDGGEIVSSSSYKKRRMVWTAELHEQFVDIVNEMGLKNAVPKKILELMNVPGLTRENVASHLQKYRLYMRRKNDSIDSQFKLQSGEDSCNMNATFVNILNECQRGQPITQQIQSIESQQHIGNGRSYFSNFGHKELVHSIASHHQPQTTMLQLQQGVEDIELMQGLSNSSHTEMFLDESLQSIILPNSDEYMKTYYHDMWDHKQSHDNGSWDMIQR